MSKISHLAWQCAKKTAAGNVYATRAAARRAARSMMLETGKPIEGFRCPHCGLCHIGKRRKETPK